MQDTVKVETENLLVPGDRDMVPFPFFPFERTGINLNLALQRLVHLAVLVINLRNDEIFPFILVFEDA